MVIQGTWSTAAVTRREGPVLASTVTALPNRPPTVGASGLRPEASSDRACSSCAVVSIMRFICSASARLPKNSQTERRPQQVTRMSRLRHSVCMITSLVALPRSVNLLTSGQPFKFLSRLTLRYLLFYPPISVKCVRVEKELLVVDTL